MPPASARMDPLYPPPTTPHATRQSNGRGRARKLPFVSWEYSTMHKVYIAGEFWLRRRGEIPLLSQIKICNSILEALWHWLCFATKSLGREVRISIILRIAIDIRSGHWIWALDPHSHRHCSKCGTHLARKSRFERPKCQTNSRTREKYCSRGETWDGSFGDTILSGT